MVGSVCVFVKSQITCGVSVYPENAVTYSAGNEGQNVHLGPGGACVNCLYSWYILILSYCYVNITVCILSIMLAVG